MQANRYFLTPKSCGEGVEDTCNERCNAADIENPANKLLYKAQNMGNGCSESGIIFFSFEKQIQQHVSDTKCDNIDQNQSRPKLDIKIGSSECLVFREAVKNTSAGDCGEQQRMQCGHYSIF